MAERVAVVLFNLGGPDRPEAVRPFLLNLFSDPAIIRAPAPIRFFLARFIAKRRAPFAVENYSLLGGKSPLLDLTNAQARAIEAQFADSSAEIRCFVAMRYWAPQAREVARAVKAWAPDRIILLPLYPQYSSTTSGSSLLDWRNAAASVNLVAETTTLCCWYEDPFYISATAALVQATLDQTRAEHPGKPIRLLFSAHGLPESIIKAGDPYQWQIEQSVAAVLTALGGFPDWSICYQSRATPVKWIGPSTDDEISRAGRDGVAVVVAPIAFVSDHSETLVELDIEYRDLAHKAGISAYYRVPAQNIDPAFIAALSGLISRAAAGPIGLAAPARRCPNACGLCPQPECTP